MCHMGTGIVPFFSILLALSCGLNNFVQEELFILTIFISWGNLGQNPEIPLEPPQYCQYSLALYLNVFFYIVAGISTLNFKFV